MTSSMIMIVFLYDPNVNYAVLLSVDCEVQGPISSTKDTVWNKQRQKLHRRRRQIFDMHAA